MKYDKCPICQLNYKLVTENMCTVCKNGSIDYEDNEDNLCPICYKTILGIDEVVCQKCLEKRALRNKIDE